MSNSIRVTNTNASGNTKTAVRVYKNDLLVGEVFPTARNPLGYLKQYKRSKYNQSLVKQLRAAGLTQDEIEQVYR